MLYYMDAPDVGDTFDRGESFGEVESVKAVSEVYAPVAGEIIAVNDALDDTPETVNESLMKKVGW